MEDSRQQCVSKVATLLDREEICACCAKCAYLTMNVWFGSVNW